MAQSVHVTANPPGGGGGGEFLFQIQTSHGETNRFIRTPQDGVLKKKKIGANSPPCGQGRNVFFPKFNNDKCTAA